MRTSCNGCRVLRKGCSDDCVIRPCLHWMKTGDAQANATVFLAKFYGRAGLLNLLNAAPHHIRPATFQSLLYEACGRVVDPINGSVGLLYSGQWHHCQLAVDAVLKGLPIIQLNPSDHLHHAPNNFNLYDIRHHMSLSSSSSSMDLRHHHNHTTDDVHIQHSPPPTTLVPTGPHRGGDSDQISINNDDDDAEDQDHDHSVSVEKHSMSMSMFSGGESTDGSNNAGQNCKSQLELDLTLGFNI